MTAMTITPDTPTTREPAAPEPVTCDLAEATR